MKYGGLDAADARIRSLRASAGGSPAAGIPPRLDTRPSERRISRAVANPRTRGAHLLPERPDKGIEMNPNHPPRARAGARTPAIPTPRSRASTPASIATASSARRWSASIPAAAGRRGPVWFGDGRHLLWSDIPNDRILKWEEETGAVSVYRRPSDFANGNTRDRQGRLVTCEHGGRRVTRTEYDGSVTVARGRNGGPAPQLPQRRGGEVGRLHLVHRPRPSASSGTTRGTGRSPSSPRRSTASTARAGELTRLADDICGPNGLCFSPDEGRLYVVESRGEPHRKILAYDVTADGRFDREQGSADRRGAGRHPGRNALRRRRQPLVRLGHGERGPRRRARVRA